MLKVVKNKDLRNAAKEAGVSLWEIAEAMKIHENTLTRRLRHELPEAEKKQILDIIDLIAQEGGTQG